MRGGKRSLVGVEPTVPSKGKPKERFISRAKNRSFLSLSPSIVMIHLPYLPLQFSVCEEEPGRLGDLRSFPSYRLSTTGLSVDSQLNGFVYPNGENWRTLRHPSSSGGGGSRASVAGKPGGPLPKRSSCGWWCCWWQPVNHGLERSSTGYRVKGFK